MRSTIFSFAVLVGTSLLGSVGCNGAEQPSAGESSESEVRSESARVDLQQFRKVAIEKIRAVVGEGVDLDHGSILFEDGAAAIGFPRASDQATLYYVVDLPTSHVPLEGGEKYAYGVGLNGLESTSFGTLVSPTDFQAVGSDIAVTLTNAVIEMSEAERKPLVERLVHELKTQCPDATVESLDAIGVVTVTATSPRTLVNAARIVRSSPIVAHSGMSPLAYPAPFVFDPFVALGDGMSQKTVDLVSLTKSSKELRESGQRFLTLPSLPIPFGPGPKPAP